MKTKEFDNAQELLQKIYDKNFSFLEFDKFSSDPVQMMIFVSRYCVGTYIAFDYKEVLEIIKTKRDLRIIMRARLIDALLSTRDLIDKKLKSLGL